MLTVPLWAWLLLSAVAVLSWLILHLRWRAVSRRENPAIGDANVRDQ
jgi:membrane protein implicated in regulation of membrane protease activity